MAETERCNQAIDRLPNGASLGAERAVVLGSIDRELNPTHLEDFEASQIPEDASGFLFTRQTLQNLANHQVDQSKRLPRKLLVQPIRLRCRDVVEVIDPDGCINDDHWISCGWRRAPGDSRSGRRAR